MKLTPEVLLIVGTDLAFAVAVLGISLGHIAYALFEARKDRRK